jgi:hypothetical protein
VRHSGQRIGARAQFIQKHAQHARASATEELDFDHFESAGGGYAISNFPHTINVKRHESNDLQAMAVTTAGSNEKVGLRPLVCFAKCRYTAVLEF